MQIERNGMILNALSVDVEEWYQTILYNRIFYNDNKITNLPQDLYKILDLLDDYNTKATFFIVGSVAKKYSDLIKVIAEKGHEIASHGYLHRLVYKLSEEEFLEDTKRSLEILNKITQSKIIGYRAPTWSIVRRTPWAIDVLKSLGLRYDSSIYPIGLDLSNSRRFPYEIRNDFIEFSPSTFQFLSCNFPFAGGTFLRFLSLKFLKNRIMEINRKGYPAMVYFHSWEFDSNHSTANLSKWKYVVQYSNVDSVKRKLNFLLQNLKFSSIRQVLKIK